MFTLTPSLKSLIVEREVPNCQFQRFARRSDAYPDGMCWCFRVLPLEAKGDPSKLASDAPVFIFHSEDGVPLDVVPRVIATQEAFEKFAEAWCAHDGNTITVTTAEKAVNYDTTQRARAQSRDAANRAAAGMPATPPAASSTRRSARAILGQVVSSLSGRPPVDPAHAAAAASLAPAEEVPA